MKSQASSRKQEKRQGHKTARAVTRQTLESGRVPKTVRGMHWSNGIEQAPLPDVPTPPRSSRKGCKKSNTGHSLVGNTTQQTMFTLIPKYDENGVRNGYERVRNFHYRGYRKPYVCEHCKRGFYRPSKAAPLKDRPSVAGYQETIPQGDHYDLYNIKMRLLGLGCRCTDCKE